MFVDSHCHLSSPELVERLPEIRAAMRAAQVDQAVESLVGQGREALKTSRSRERGGRGLSIHSPR